MAASLVLCQITPHPTTNNSTVFFQPFAMPGFYLWVYKSTFHSFCYLVITFLHKIL